jgi:hypothetical protein
LAGRRRRGITQLIAELKTELARLEAQAGPKRPRRGRNRLTERKIATLKIPGVHADGNGLYFRIRKGTLTKSWLSRYTGPDGKVHDYGHGGHPSVGLAEARQRNEEIQPMRRDGIEPVQHRHQQGIDARLDRRKTMTFKDCTKASLRMHEKSWSNQKHIRQWPKTLETYAFPVIGDLPVDVIDTPLVIKVLEPIWQDRTETASRVRSRITATARRAARGYRNGACRYRARNRLLNQAKPAAMRGARR